MIDRIYYKFHRLLSKEDERGEYSAGYWQDKVRNEALKMSGGRNGRLLEIGCGEGLFLAKIRSCNKCIEVFGIDNRKDILDKADERLKNKDTSGISLTLADAVKLPFEGEYFDIVVCINVIFNLPSIQVLDKVLKEISRVLKKEGIAIMDFRNKLNPFLYIKYKLAPYYDKTVKDLSLKTYSLREISSLAAKYGFEIIEISNIGSKLGKIAPVFVLKIKKI